jgi:putative spermidine/putrescine transport system permease protein
MTAITIPGFSWRLSFFPPARRPPAAWIAGAALLAPAMGFFIAFFVIPALTLLADGFMTQSARGTIGGPLTLTQYAHFFGTALYSHVLLTTLRISLMTALLAALLGYPVALVMSRGGATVSRIVTMVTIAPLIVSVVVRTYGWQLILANSGTGILNAVLLWTGLIQTPLRLLYSETAVVIGSLHVFLPMMVLPLASALGRISPSLEEAASTLGAPAWRVFRRVTLPLSLPGLAVGFTLVFSLTAGSFVTPAILGGTSAQMLGNLIEQQILVVYDWPFGAAIASVLVAIVLGVNLIMTRALEGRRAA